MSGENREPGGMHPMDEDNLGRFAYAPDGLDEGDTPPEERTVRLPPELLPERLKPVRPVRVLGSDGSRRPLWLGVLAVVLVVAVIGGGVAYALHGQGSASGKGPHGCASNTPCAVADAYLLAYTGFKFEQMYSYTSATSRQQFSDPKILRGAYKDAHDYIVNRTAAILDEAEVYSLSATPGNVVTNGPSAATVPARIVMQSTRVGSFTQDISIPLVLEGGAWHVNWTPGLIFPKLDDPAFDPTYSRLVQLVPYDAARGTIYDAGGDAIAKDDMVEQIEVTPGQIKDENTLVNTLSKALDMTPAEVRANYDDSRPSVTFVIRTITSQSFSQVQSAIAGLAGVSVQAATGRVYPYGYALAPVTGYVGDVSPDDLKNDSAHYYETTDQIGRAGVEAWGEQYLRPTKGGKLQIVERNADGSDGQPVSTIAERAAVAGDDIHTTIDLKNQLHVMQYIKPQIDAHGNAGGIFATDPTTGAVLVMASYPVYDPNLLSLGITNEEYQGYQKSGAFLNYAIQDPRSVGSIFKIVDLAAALQNGISKDTTFTCHGSYQVPGESIVRHETETNGHGTLTPAVALAPSCDVIYWQVAIKLNSMDPNILPKMAKAMGMGATTGVVGVPAGVEDPGLVPDPQYEASKGKTWNASYAADLAVGQGDFMATPAQVAMMTAAVGNNGTRVQPRLVSQVTNSSGAVVQTFAPKTLGTLPISADNLATLQAAMLAAVSDPSATSYLTWKGFPIRAAGKTGSAEAGVDVQPHSWFTAYAPASPVGGPSVTPTIAAGVEMQNAGFGAELAAPITRSLFTTFFNLH